MIKQKRISFVLRLPLALDDWIEVQSETNHRSKNAEIVFRLETAMRAEKAEAPAAGEASRP